MITAIHTLIYSDDAERTRAFLRDVLGWANVDTGDGWLIFATGPSEMGVHPTSEGEWSTAKKHEISLICDDIETTVTDLKAKGANFKGEVEDHGFGLVIYLEVPGGAADIMIYQPKYDPPALTLKS